MNDSTSFVIGSEAVGFAELCRCCALSHEEALAFIAEGIAEPLVGGTDPSDWRFDAPRLARLRRARRLQRELELDIAAVALALDLLEEIDRLRAQLPRV